MLQQTLLTFGPQPQALAAVCWCAVSATGRWRMVQWALQQVGSAAWLPPLQQVLGLAQLQQLQLLLGRLLLP